MLVRAGSVSKRIRLYSQMYGLHFKSSNLLYKKHQNVQINLRPRGNNTCFYCTTNQVSPQLEIDTQQAQNQLKEIQNQEKGEQRREAIENGATQRRKRVLSGVQPTGYLHIGNYFGAIKNWIGLQDEYDTFYCCVDMHAITLPHDPVDLREATFRNAATYIAAGIDPSKSSIFVQSHVRAHAELTWLLSCCTPIGWLRRMAQYKDKVRQREELGYDSAEEVGTGLMVYPVLMAADILLYQADLVPVGDDQKQHLELARNIAHRTNTLFGGKKWQKRGGKGSRIFKIPEPMIPKQGARIMSLADGTSKMSKSNPIETSRIHLLDPPDVIKRKIKVAKTDSLGAMEWDNPERPECRNLLSMYSIATGMNSEEVMEDIRELTFGTFKPRLADALIENLRPIQEKYKELENDRAYVENVLLQGAEQAEEVANKTLLACQDAMGFLPRPQKL